MSVLRLAIPSPLRRLFDYLPPIGMDESSVAALRPGQRLSVPFGSRRVTAYLVAVSGGSELPRAALKHAEALLDAEPLVPPTLVQLCDWAARYYHHPPGEVFGAAFPRPLREGKQHQPAGVPGWRLTTRGMGLPPGALARSPRQAEALALLQATSAVSNTRLRERGITAAVLRELGAKELVEKCTLPRPPMAPIGRPGLALNPEQSTVLAGLLAAREGFSCHLLEGVTGAGKTEIYLQLIADCLARGRQALVLIPEIGLTPQTLDRFNQRFAARIVVLHSGLGEAERYRSWEAARDGSAHIVIGTRSAVFTPLRSPGLIIVDEEHDGSYKQQDGFRYSARDVAVKRGQLEACPVLLGSATPSLESLHNVALGRYQLHRLRQRAGASVLPTISAIDLRRQELQAGLSGALLAAIDSKLAARQQVLLFLNRRGYAPTLQCHDCGWVAECLACDARLTVHRRPARLRCHHCGAIHTLPRECPSCHSGALLTAGLGTEQTEDFLRRRFDRWPVFRVDSDSMQARHAMSNLVTEINRGEPGILLGTQMLTKGHHFPAVGLVAVIDADALLFSADFRGEERMAQLLTQVAGRAGRAEQPGEVVLQTHYPDHPAVQAMLNVDYSAQARTMLAGRQAAGMPPAGQLVILRTDCGDAAQGDKFLQAVRDRAQPALPAGARLIGPLPSPMQRRAGKFRSQLILLAPDRRAAQLAADILVAEAESVPVRRGLKWSVDVDPQDLY
ncbi:MAG: primosomal protein N' [Gammaproteobacteria bacterium]|nr:primosomal protein N' [Gammaproteobacteria bacterium]MDH5170823.1 primosomal protein N' [Gammaproteobacteria bacterium]